jgi:hypothetical protein
MIVIIDTNIFVRETHLLRKKAGPPFIHFLRAAKGKLFIPEILALEYREQAQLAAAEEVRTIDSAFGRIQSLVGYRDDYQVPSSDEVRESVEKRLKELEQVVLAMPLIDDVLLSASRRSIAKQPPTSKSDHGLKDCIIWESLLRLELGSDIRLVTRDAKAFLSGDGLSVHLLEEAASRKLNVRAYDTLEGVLKELQLAGAPVLHFDLVFDLLHGALQPVYQKALAQWSLSSLGGDFETVFEPYSTEAASRLYVTFVQTIQAGDALAGDVKYTQTKVRFRGSFNFLVDENRLTDLQVEGEALLATGGAIIVEDRTAFASANITLGRRDIRYTFRKPLMGAGTQDD